MHAHNHLLAQCCLRHPGQCWFFQPGRSQLSPYACRFILWWRCFSTRSIIRQCRLLLLKHRWWCFGIWWGALVLGCGTTGSGQRGVDALLRQRRQCVVAPTPSPTRGGQRKRKSLKLSACNSGNKIAAPAPAPPDASPPPALFVALPPASSPSLDRKARARAGGVPQSGSWVHAAGAWLCSHAVALADRSYTYTYICMLARCGLG